MTSASNFAETQTHNQPILNVQRADLTSPNSSIPEGSQFYLKLVVNLSASSWPNAADPTTPVVLNGPHLVSDWGRLGDFLNNPNDSIVVKNSPSLRLNDSFSISTWIELKSTGSSSPGRDWFTIVLKGPKWDSSAYSLLICANCTDRTVLLTINGVRVLSAPTHIPLDQWENVILTFQKPIFQLYVNGNLSGQVIFNGSIHPSNSDLYVGWEPSGSYPFIGIVSELGMLNSTLDTTQVRAISSGAAALSRNESILDIDFDHVLFTLQNSVDGQLFKNVTNFPLGTTFIPLTEEVPGTYYYRVIIRCDSPIGTCASNTATVIVTRTQGNVVQLEMEVIMLGGILMVIAFAWILNRRQS